MMRQRILVKVCGMRERSNALAIACCMPDYMGFIFVSESPRFVEPAVRDELLQSIPATIKTVGVFRDAEIGEVEETVRRFRLSAVQLHGAEDSGFIAECKRKMPSCYVFKALALTESRVDFTKLPKGADLFMFDGARPGSGEEFDWSLLDNYSGSVPFFIAGGIGVHSCEKVRRFVSTHPLCIGIDINSKVESSAGIKDERAVRQVLEGVRL
jgi:phosphoribosylanthranilate isomerase